MFLCETISQLVFYGCCQVLDQLVCFLVVNFSEACLHFLALTFYPGLNCHLPLCQDLSSDFSIVVVSSMNIMIMDLRGNPGLPPPTLFAKEFSCFVSYRLVEVGDHGVQLNIFLYQRGKR